MKKALVVGANGQDGSFLIENLLRRGYKVIGIDLHKEYCYDLIDTSFEYRQIDLRKKQDIMQLLEQFKPLTIFHFAAIHGSSGTAYENLWQDMLAVNVASVHIFLEFIRTTGMETKLIYASSGKVFGPKYPRLISEHSQKFSKCLYTITKNTALDLINYYRANHGLIGSVIYYFNHESARRPASFFIPKIIDTLAKAVNDQHYRASIYNLDFICDWGSAEEYMDISIEVAEIAAGEDFVLGTGKTLTAKDFVKTLFSKYGIDYKNHLYEISPQALPLSNRWHQVVNQKLLEYIGRVPVKDIFSVCESILEKKFCLKAPAQRKNPTS